MKKNPENFTRCMCVIHAQTHNQIFLKNIFGNFKSLFSSKENTSHLLLTTPLYAKLNKYVRECIKNQPCYLELVASQY